MIEKKTTKDLTIEILKAQLLNAERFLIINYVVGVFAGALSALFLLIIFGGLK